MMAYLKKEDGYRKVVELLTAEQKKNAVLMNEINVGECFYIIARARGMKEADYFIEVVLPNLPVTIVENSFDDIIAASRIKAKYPMSYADCFAVATAMREKAAIVTGDPEFKEAAHMVEIIWV